MAIYGAAENQYLNGGGYGGGFGGWGGGYGCGIAPIGLVGITDFFGRGRFDGHGGHGGNCGCKCNADCHDVLELMEKLGDVDKDIFLSANSTQKDICSLKDSFATTNAAIANVNYNQAINTKDIIHDIDIQSCNLGSKIDKCCCETNHNIDNKFFAISKQMSDCCCELQKEGLKNTQVILDKLNATELAELREKLCRCEKENDFFRFNGAIAANFASFRAATAGSNFNTGTQSTDVRNNSGQQVGA